MIKKRYWIFLVVIVTFLCTQLILSWFAGTSVDVREPVAVFPAASPKQTVRCLCCVPSLHITFLILFQDAPEANKKVVGQNAFGSSTGNKKNQNKVAVNVASKKSKSKGTLSRLKSLRTRLDVSQLDFRPNCDIEDKAAISAINRAVSASCKRDLAELACRLQTKSLYPAKLPNYCHIKGMSPVVSYLPVLCFYALSFRCIHFFA